MVNSIHRLPIVVNKRLFGNSRLAKIQSFKDLEIWQRSISLVEKIYGITRKFPKEETYGLISQMRRAATSVPSNIAEGFARFYNTEYKQFLFISLGSCAELTTQLIIAGKLGYLESEKSDVLLDEIEQISKMIMGLIKKLNSKN
jgi:four helix bundle protein